MENADEWDNVILDEDGVTSAAWSSMAAGIRLDEMPAQIIEDDTLIAAYQYGVQQTITDIRIAIAECHMEFEDARHWYQQEKIAESRLLAANKLRLSLRGNHGI